jgi:hypothetical protein
MAEEKENVKTFVQNTGLISPLLFKFSCDLGTL